ncbi:MULTISPECIES: cytidine deaminase [unclassified Bacillus (in: firmicutes)]|uniref:cytidine deaminase n=1 Tax=unclassified Bacillus (in: firmicutes) TaxID=185979 RepID=UPI001BECC3E4|nr:MULTISPECIES: cytidine deaminase [unclassified Bacillus (in: firmicutes)]MBT2640590.1 cytidine deaminase [Bacillus sp. ISL-39]MBT2663316.1 cytidine deaminase [Bacillus sp. ISL-45]
MNKEQLVESARQTKKNAYAPYSKFPVGAALLLKDGTVFNGVNVENVSFGATNCAERTAIFTAVANGYKKGDFEAIAVSGDTADFLPPCSICRQVMAEFFSPDMPVYLTNDKKEIRELALKELLPYAFTDLDM